MRLELFRSCFSRRQRKYFVTVLLGLVECEGRRTLRGLLQAVWEQVSLSGLSRFLGRWPWSPLDLVHVWLAAMRREAGLPVPEPVPRLNGGLLTPLSIPGIPEARHCALLRWVKGRLLENGRLEHYRAQGRLMARMHNFTQQWQQLASDQTKRHYNWNGLFMNHPEIGLPPGKSWEYLPADWGAPFESVARQFRQLIDAWGTGPEVYGLIHADMGLDANLLFWRGQPRPIDFDGSGFGYWMYDLAAAIAHCIGTADYPRVRDALFAGYAEHRSLPDGQFAQWDLFTAAFYVYYILWMVGVAHLHPGCLDQDQEEAMYRGAAFIIGRDAR